MADIINMRASLRDMVEGVLKENPDAETGLLVVFSKDGVMHTTYNCNERELAHAGTRLIYIANKD